MRTGKIGLRKFLHNANVLGYNTPTCQKCDLQRDQDVAHILFVCPAFADLRREFREKVGDSTTDIRRVLNDPLLARSAAHLIRSTGLINHFRLVQVGPN